MTWEKCTLRSWLNNYFLETAFAEDERDRILPETITSGKYKDNNPGIDTVDQIFVLSLLEVLKYFSTGTTRLCVPTNYAVNQGCREDYCWWWLRTINGGGAIIVGYDGGIGCFQIHFNGYDNYVFEGRIAKNERGAGGVRPAMWITTSDTSSFPLESENELSEANYKPDNDLKQEDLQTIGSIVTFGTYEQDDNPENGQEPIEWIVLDVQEGKSLLVSKLGLDNQPYNTNAQNVTWETCSLRTWLNESFLNSAFNTDEQARIPVVSVTASNNPNSDIDLGNDTMDKVFLLSIQEIESYFPLDTDRVCSCTAFIDNSRYIGLISYAWWMRTLGANAQTALYVGGGGGIVTDGDRIIKTLGVRPAIWVNWE